ncbi:hypothetical protein ACFOZ0_04215 [Streptomyces yaanensis]|uniref:Uncharacterized protein n=1 Tax=Streptomyces yaanensis TaxID=1142239 RepID=A0ABV7S7M9_9ACTN|nr:hypothetical protein [Streptomyces sp. CGMCC 4.7035]WNC00068.1 hypothetical protein Q2K21_19435 [Streptomyces sp. CGMCC 4.7035]
MLIIGLLLLAATGAFAGLAIAGNLSGGPEYTVSMLDHPIATMNALAIFSSGLALALLFALGLAAAVNAATHHRHRGPRSHRARGTTAAHM